MAAILATVYTPPVHNLGGIGVATKVVGKATHIYNNPNDNKAFKVSNILLYGPEGAGDDGGGGDSSPTGAEAQSWSDG